MVISMCKLLGMNIVVEGVETLEQLEWLCKKGCREFQGFYFSQPVPASEFRDLLRRQSSLRAQWEGPLSLVR